MTLTLGPGPLSKPNARRRLQLRLGRRARPPPLLRRPIRAACARWSATASCSTRARGRLLHESNHLPEPLRRRSRTSTRALLEPSEHTTHCPFKGDASYWSLRVGDRVVRGRRVGVRGADRQAAWLEGFASLYWEQGRRWFVEDERLFGQLRDPYHRVDVFEALAARHGHRRRRASSPSPTRREAALRDRPAAAGLRAGRGRRGGRARAGRKTRSVPVQGRGDLLGRAGGRTPIEDAAWISEVVNSCVCGFSRSRRCVPLNSSPRNCQRSRPRVMSDS